ncbi:MAG: carbamate kinase [Thermoleophilia bacterium]|nr:carbamate kinase [Thermoleophilia bacterium]
MRTVVALGGHLLAREALDPSLLDPLRGDELLFTHGNGPQVGEHPAEPLGEAVALTQAQIGSDLALALDAVCVVTHVEVDPADPAFEQPTKPIGPFLEARPDGPAIHDDACGWRRVVPSPRPLTIRELDAIRALAAGGPAVVCCGGGGIPVSRGRVLDAVIDKDRISALLAELLGADRLVVLTDVDAVYRDFGTPHERAVSRLTPDEADALLPELSAGSMRPKLEACAAFARATGNEAMIASARALEAALEARAGTRVAPSGPS